MKTNGAFVIANHFTDDVNETTRATKDRQAGLNVDDFIITLYEHPNDLPAYNHGLHWR